MGAAVDEPDPSRHPSTSSPDPLPARPPRTRRRAFVRTALAVAVAAMGVVNLLSALLSHPPERLLTLRRLVPTDVLDTSRTFTLLAGALLLVTAWGLRRGKRRSFVLALFLCAISVPVNLLKALDVEEATLAAGMLFALGVSADAFRVRSAEMSFRGLRARVVWAIVALTAYVALGSWWLELRIGHHVSLARMAADAGYELFGIGAPVALVPHTAPAAARRIAEWYARSLPLIGFVLVLGTALAALRPARHRRRHRVERERVRAILHAYGDSTVASFALDDDCDYFFSRNGRAVIAYHFVGDVLLAIGDPVGPAEELPVLLADFARHCEASDWTFAFFQARPEYLPLYRARGWSPLHLGEDPVLWTDRFSLEGADVGDARRAVRKAERAGLEVIAFGAGDRPFDPDGADRALYDELRAISAAWVARHGAEKGFCMGRFDPERLRASWLVVARAGAGGRVEAFVTWEPIWARNGWSLDLMRRRDDSAAGVMELLIVRSVEAAKARGEGMLSLALSALASVEDPAAGAPAEPQAIARARVLLRRHLARFYDFEGLFRWKRKFAPAFEDRYLVHPGTLPRVALALVRAQSPGGLRAYARALWPRRSPAGGGAPAVSDPAARTS